MLRLVHPAPEGQDPPKVKKREKAAALFLTDEEKRRVRASMRNIARAYGGFDVLATVTGIPVTSLYCMMQRGRGMSGTVAIRIAQAGGVSVDSVLSGGMKDASCCPTCGHKPGTGRLIAGATS